MGQQQLSAADAAEKLKKKFDEEKKAVDDLLKSFEAKGAFIDLQQTIGELPAKLADMRTAYEAGKITASEYWLGVQEESNNAASEVADYLVGLGNVPAEVISNITTLVEKGELDKAMELINHWQSLNGKSITLWTNAKTQAQWVNGSVTPIKAGSQYATGTMSAFPGMALVGEDGPELMKMRGGERVFNAGETSRLMAGATLAQGGNGGTVNVYVTNNSADPNAVLTVIKQYARRGGVL